MPVHRSLASRRRRHEITGRSTKRYSSHASGTAAAPSSNRIHSGSGSSEKATACGITCSGQCTRYSEYEIAPTNCIGASPSTLVACHLPGAAPPMIISAVARTGSAAVQPGNGVPSSYTSAITSSEPRPAQASSPMRGDRSQAAPVRSSIATSPPTPSSQARVGREKKVHGCEISISSTQARNDTAVRSTIAAISRRSLRRHSQNTTASTAGQNR